MGEKAMDYQQGQDKGVPNCRDHILGLGDLKLY